MYSCEYVCKDVNLESIPLPLVFKQVVNVRKSFSVYQVLCRCANMKQSEKGPLPAKKAGLQTQNYVSPRLRLTFLQAEYKIFKLKNL